MSAKIVYRAINQRLVGGPDLMGCLDLNSMVEVWTSSRNVIADLVVMLNLTGSPL